MNDEATTEASVVDATASAAATKTDGSTTESAGEPALANDPAVAAQAEVARLREQLLRTAADFDNFRKRTRRDVEDATRRGTEELLRTLLPVFDNLERAATHAEQAPEAKAIADGVRMVLKQFVDTIERVGIVRVATVGQPFDPLVHEAVQQLETDAAAPGTVIAEIAGGYRFGERLVRAAMVVVAKAKAS